MSVKHIRLGQQHKERLSRLKYKTGIQQWNILCRWALATSLAEPTPPTPLQVPADSNVEMSWEVFAGEYGDVWLAALRQRCIKDGLPHDDATVGEQLKLHLHRGIGYITTTNQIQSIADLCKLAVNS